MSKVKRQRNAVCSFRDKSNRNVQKKSPPAQHEDRRVERTLQLLQQAIISLTLENGYEPITVQNIAERANVGRATFYSHFANKDQLLLRDFDDLGELLSKEQQAALATAGPPEKRVLRFTGKLFEHVAKRRRFQMAMLDTYGGTIAERHLRRIIRELVRKELKTLGTRLPPRVPLEAVVRYLVGGLSGLAIWWLIHDSNLSPAEIDEVFRQLSICGLSTVLTASNRAT
jgi:AcrR family transcriptional regulator